MSAPSQLTTSSSPDPSHVADCSPVAGSDKNHAQDEWAPTAERAAILLDKLEGIYPDAHCALDFRTPLELLVATILSAQCTDERVNMVTPTLFARFPSAADYAGADPQELERLIRSTGFYHNKARNIQGACRRIVDVYAGEVPQGMDELLTLPGVARKTANVVRGNVWGLADGIAVDTHVTRLAQRLRLTKQTDAAKIECDLMPLIPKTRWVMTTHLLIAHGRAICKAPRPLCGECQIASLCPSSPLHAPTA